MPTNNSTLENINFETLKLEVKGRLGILRISRPQALNALNTQVLGELDRCLTAIQESQALGALIVTGEGEKSFVAGADIKEMMNLSAADAEKFSRQGQTVFRKLETLSIPVIAAVNGFAFGGGLELALSCDFIYASEKAKLGLPEVSLGLVPGFGGTVRLSRVVGKARAKEMILTGAPLSAEESFSAGLVNRVFPAENLMAEVQKCAEVLLSRGPLAMKTAKLLVDETLEMELENGLVQEAHRFGALFSSPEAREGTLAFVEKRKAQFIK